MFYPSMLSYIAYRLDRKPSEIQSILQDESGNITLENMSDIAFALGMTVEPKVKGRRRS
jgi:hypothetical protein